MFHLGLFKFFKNVKIDFSQLTWRCKGRYRGGGRIYHYIFMRGPIAGGLISPTNSYYDRL